MLRIEWDKVAEMGRGGVEYVKKEEAEAALRRMGKQLAAKDARIAELEEAARWRTAEERPGIVPTSYAVGLKDGSWAKYYWTGAEWAYWSDRFRSMISLAIGDRPMPTHWRPIDLSEVG